MARIKKENAEKEVVETAEITETAKSATRDNNKKVSIPQTYEIPVKSNVQGTLVFVSKKSGQEIVWGETGDVAYLEYADLITMRNTAKKFFECNWIIIEDTNEYTADEILYALNVDRYYNQFVTIDEIFEMSNDEIEKIVPTFSKGYKEMIASKLLDFIRIEHPSIDSTLRRSAFEKALGISIKENI